MSFGGLPCHWESTTPTLVVKASTSVMKGSSGFGWTIEGAVVKVSFSWWIAEVALGTQDRHLGLLQSIVVSREHILLKLAMKQHRN